MAENEYFRLFNIKTEKSSVKWNVLSLGSVMYKAFNLKTILRDLNMILKCAKKANYMHLLLSSKKSNSKCF